MQTIPIRREGGQGGSAVTGTVLTSLPPLSVYVHVPWCVRKCPYCDFNSHALAGELPEAEYLDALAADLEQSLPLIWGRKVYTVFIGGGTPSLLSEKAMDSLVAMLRAYLQLAPDVEITMEANPGTVEAARFRAYAASGVNRISIGVQSFNDRHLQALGRIHDGDAARAAIDAAQHAVGRVNLDLMTALPGQSLAELEADVQTALAFGAEHLSLYHLTMEPNTVFAKYPPQDLPDADTAALMQDRVASWLGQKGYEHYEVSAHAQPGARCRHNLNYWEFGDYLGIGPGAHGKLSFHDRIVRYAKLRNPDSWMAQAIRRDGSHVAQEEGIVPDALPFEFMLNALRLRHGVPSHYFGERTGLPWTAISRSLERAAARGLVDPDPTRIAPTELGWRFLNDLQEMFL